METIVVPKKVERHVLKAVDVLCEEPTETATKSEIYEQVRYQMRNLVPVAHFEQVFDKCLEELCERGLIRRIDYAFGRFIRDDEISSLNSSLNAPQYSIFVDEVSVGDSSFKSKNSTFVTSIASQISTSIAEDEVSVRNSSVDSQSSVSVASIAPQISTSFAEDEVSVRDSSFDSQSLISVASIAPHTQNFVNVTNSEAGSVNQLIESNKLAALFDEISASSENSNDCICIDNSDKQVPLPMAIKVENQMEPTKEHEI
uniref:Uncharacterized protein n=1 Tax=Glossina brevipalpis TaxID=37001 RepID=A0A1A9WPD9_9MUSC